LAGVAKMMIPRISIIIPTLNEAVELPETLVHTIGAYEVIIADGGSTDDTVAIAQKNGCKITTARGRGNQMNAGAALSTGDILVFLHADTYLPANWTDPILQTLSHTENTLGAFRLEIRAKSKSLSFMARIANWRSKWLKSPYGDQAFFIHRDYFYTLGQFEDVPIMDDYLLVRRAAKMGPIILAPDSVSTSARRWQKRGILRTFLINQLVIIGYYCGVPLSRLAQLYRGRPVRQ
jgi:rSAM/selenodomain-associated transferase 2